MYEQNLIPVLIIFATTIGLMSLDYIPTRRKK